jgi:hypothetical protein
MATDKQQLEMWIARSQRVQRTVVVVAVVAGVASYGLRLTDVVPGFVGTVLMLGAAITAVSGFWVTAAHIADWRARLRSTDAR